MDTLNASYNEPFKFILDSQSFQIKLGPVVRMDFASYITLGGMRMSSSCACVCMRVCVCHDIHVCGVCVCGCVSARVILAIEFPHRIMY